MIFVTVYSLEDDVAIVWNFEGSVIAFAIHEVLLGWSEMVLIWMEA